MAKKEKKTKKQVEMDSVQTAPTPPKKKKTKKILFVIIILLIITGIGFFFRKPIKTYGIKAASHIPYINKWIKPKEQDPYENYNKQAFIKVIEGQEEEIETLEKQIEALTNEKQMLTQKVTDLKTYETKYSAFTTQKAAWDEKIARTDKTLFIEQFEQVYPEQAEEIYKTLKTENILSKEQKSFASMVGQMDADQAAKALEQLLVTDPEIIKVLFDNMEQERKASILSSMDAKNAATVIKLVSPNILVQDE